MADPLRFQRRPVNHKPPFVVGTGGATSLALDIWANFVKEAFPRGGVYLVGSAAGEKKQPRDIDVVCILDDDEFEAIFGRPSDRHMSLNPRWTAICLAFSRWASDWTGLPIDFKFQGQTFANDRHPGRRLGIGIFPTNHAPGYCEPEQAEGGALPDATTA